MKAMIRLMGAASIAAMLAATPAAAAIATFTYDGHLDSWTAPKFGLYAVTAWGASGGLSGLGYYINDGGRGVGLRAFFLLDPSQPLTIAVGGMGYGSVYEVGGGGGGGSFVVRGGQALVVAGGGGGAGVNVGAAGGDATAFPYGDGSGGPAQYGIGDAYDGGGGGGFLSDGEAGLGFNATGGLAYPTLTGGESGWFKTPEPRGVGGFGGGGGGGACGRFDGYGGGAGGGGGGYTGGGGGGCYGYGDPGEGGGSFSAAQVTQVLGYRDLYQDGLVQIMPIPEPSSWALLIAGFGFIGLALRRLRGRLAGPRTPSPSGPRAR